MRRVIVFVGGILLFAAWTVGAVPFPVETPVDPSSVKSMSVVGASSSERVSAVAIQKTPIEKSDPSPMGLFRGLLSKAKKKAGSIKDRLGDWYQAGKEFVEKEKNLPGAFKQGAMSENQKMELSKLAGKRRDLAVQPGDDIADARNAHRTNTFEELKESLEGDYNWLECDVRREGPMRPLFHVGGDRRPITSHDPYQTNGMLFEDWLAITKASGRGLKMDFKDSEAIDDVLVILKKNRIPDERLILNVGISDPGEASLKSGSVPLRDRPVDDSRIQHIRRDFPKAIINLSPGTSSTTDDGKYTVWQIEQMIRYAKASGQPVMFPLRADMVTREIVQSLKAFGKVAIWNDPGSYSPKDVAAEVGKFRQWGVEGMIDIRTH